MVIFTTGWSLIYKIPGAPGGPCSISVSSGAEAPAKLPGSPGGPGGPDKPFSPLTPGVLNPIFPFGPVGPGNPGGPCKQNKFVYKNDGTSKSKNETNCAS